MEKYNTDYQYYCPKCGDMHFISNDNNKCVICGTDMIETPHEYDLSKNFMDEIMKMGWKDNKHILCEKEQSFFDEVISKSPEFDINLYNNRDSIMKQREQNFNATIEHGKAILEAKNHKPKCPYCGSTNLSKISAVRRAVKTSLFGIFGAIDDAGKTYQCNDCKCKF